MSGNTAGRTVMVQGRIVWTSGKSVFEGKQKLNFQTKQPIIDSKTGQPAMEYGFGLAVPKSALGQTGPGQPGEIWGAMHAEAQLLYPQIPPKFAMKYKDGDSIDDKGRPFSDRDGHAGHIILACTTTIPIKFFRHENGQNIMISDGIKCGDYVQVQLGIKAHGPINNGNPGLYLNPQAVLFLGYGTAIVNAPSGNDIFGSTAPALPPGASAVPVAPLGGAPLMPQAQFQAPNVAPQMIQQQVQAPQPMAPQPHYGILPQAHQPQQPMMGGVPGFAPNAAPQAQQFAPPPMMQPAPQQFQQPMGQPPGFPPFPGGQ